MNIKLLAVSSMLLPAVFLTSAPLSLVAAKDGGELPEVHANAGSHVNNRANFVGTITVIDGNNLTVTRKGQTATIVVDTTNAKFMRKFGGASNISELSVGDQVQIQGTWTATDKTAASATKIHDVSIQKRNDTFGGTISSLSSDGFVLQTKHRGDQTVKLSSSTKIMGRKSAVMTPTDLHEGDSVTVRGLWNKTSNTVNADVIRDASFPATK